MLLGRLLMIAAAALVCCPAAAGAQARRPPAADGPAADAPFLLDEPATASAPLRKATRHLELETWPETDRDGGVRLVVKVRPRRGMRLYAPGEKGYVGVALVLDAPGRATTGAVSLPSPSTYIFPPTGDANRVYADPFTMEVPVRFPSASRPGRLTGRFEYQACDDTLCYKPARVPLAWAPGR